MDYSERVKKIFSDDVLSGSHMENKTKILLDLYLHRKDADPFRNILKITDDIGAVSSNIYDLINCMVDEGKLRVAGELHDYNGRYHRQKKYKLSPEGIRGVETVLSDVNFFKDYLFSPYRILVKLGYMKFSGGIPAKVSDVSEQIGEPKGRTYRSLAVLETKHLIDLEHGSEMNVTNVTEKGFAKIEDISRLVRTMRNFPDPPNKAA